MSYGNIVYRSVSLSKFIRMFSEQNILVFFSSSCFDENNWKEVDIIFLAMHDVHFCMFCFRARESVSGRFGRDYVIGISRGSMEVAA